MLNNQAIFESLFNRNLSRGGNIDFLKEITATHPYFSPAQFYLLQQTPAGTEAYDQQVDKTVILFNNPHWLNFQLGQTNEAAHLPGELLAAGTSPVDDKHETAAELPDDTDATAEKAMEVEIEPMKIELKMTAEKTNPEEALLFEPMHLVDYFASQGIKLSEEIQPADKLGKQLKSFTEWLKTMKKIHVEPDTETTDNTDSSIQTLADISNTEAEVLTESMAEVFARQGKMNKAREVYQKLSLLNPAKSAYFAAKIENLKGI